MQYLHVLYLLFHRPFSGHIVVFIVNFQKILKNDLKSCHKKFLKTILGLNRHTPIIGLDGETGQYPIFIDTFNQSLNYIKRLQTMTSGSLLYDTLTDFSHLYINHHEERVQNLKRILSDDIKTSKIIIANVEEKLKLKHVSVVAIL